MTELRDRLQTTLGGGYRVTDELAGGGMSRVFVAEETELGRAVVVKVLPPDLGAGLNVDRFRREIQLAARLQHPHIVPLLSAGSREGLLYYTMPFIEGQTLRARLARSGELPIPEALRVLRDVADALEYAHAHGVVHRDIKPENVMISGHHALVTDFGVSKALSSATGEQSLTSIGVALGTPTYMSPEQATADPMMDHRTDIYALGILGYELLTGHPPFSGGTPQQVLAAQVTQTPEPITKHRPHVPPQLAALIMRCLEKKPADRWQGAHEVREQLEALATPSGGTVPITAATIEGQRTKRWLKREIVLGSAAAAILLAALLASRYFGGGDRTAFAVGATHQVTNDPGIEITPALSPDGRLLAYAAGGPFQTRIYVTQVSGGQPVEVARALRGSQRAPRWSPDGARLVFVGPDGIYVVPALGGQPRRIIASDPSNPFIAPTWSRDGQYLAYAGAAGNIYIAEADGKNSRILFQTRFPHSIEWSPDDSRIAFVNGNAEFIYRRDFANIAPSAIWVGGRDGKKAVRVTDDVHINMSPVWTADGKGVIYMSNAQGGRDVYYQRLDRNGAPRGQPQRLTTGLSVHGISASSDGRYVAYSTLATSVGIWTVPVPARSVSVAAARQITSTNERIETVEVSPDGEWLAFDSDRAGNADIYRMPSRGGEAEQLTRDPADEFNPSWSPDGKQLAFHSWRSGSRDSYVMAADGASPRLIAGGPSHEWGGAFSPDGRWIAFLSDRPESPGMYIVPVSGGTPRRIAAEPQWGSGYLWSPDGRWILSITRRGSELLMVSPSGGTPRTIGRAQDLGGALAFVGGFSVDGRTVYVRVLAQDGSVPIGAVGIDGSNPRIVVRFDEPNRPAYAPIFSTDGRNFYFTIGKHEADIWVMELQKK